MSDVFISYSRKDKEFVQHLNEALAQAQRETWVDWEDIPVTSEWWLEIQRGIEAADSFVFVMSPNSIASVACGNEVEHAVAYNKRLIPVVRRDVRSKEVNKALASHNWLYYRDQDDFNAAFQQLIQALDTDLDYVRAHTRLLVRALDWEEHKRDSSYLLQGNDLRSAEGWLAESGSKDPKPTELQTQYIVASRRATTVRQRRLLGGVSVALALTLILALVSLGLFGAAETSRRESDDRGTAVAQQAGTATNALGLSQVRGTEAAQQAATAISAEATSVRRSDEWKSLAWAVDSSQALAADNTDLALALAVQANSIGDPPPQARAALVAAAYAPGTATVYSGQHTSWVDAAAVSPDSQWLLSASYDGKLVLWNTATGAVVHSSDFGTTDVTTQGVSMKLGAIIDIVFDPASASPVALFSQSDGTLHLWDVQAWREISHADAGNFIDSVALSPDGTIAATGLDGEQDNLILWDTRTMTPLRTLKGHTATVTRVTFSPDGKQLLSGSEDSTVRLWDVATGDLIRTIGPVTDASEPALVIRGLVFSAPLDDGTPTGIGATNSGLIIAWNLATGEEIRRYQGISTPAALSDIAISADQRLLASSGLDGIVYLWDTATGRMLRRYLGHSGALTWVAFSPDERSLFSASNDNTLRRWYTVSGAEVRSLSGGYHAGGISGLAINADETRALTGGGAGDPAVVLWDLKTGAVIRRMEGHTDSVTAVAFSPDGKTAVSGSFDGTLRVWDLETGAALHVYNLNLLAIPSVVVSPDGKTALVSEIISGFLPGAAGAVIDLNTGDELKHFDLGKGVAISAVYSPDRSQILIGGGTVDTQGTITLWDAGAASLIRTFAPGHNNPVSSVEFSADGKQVLSSAQDFNSILWDTASGHEIRRFVGHSDIVSAARFTPDDQTMVSGSYDGTLRLWNVNTGGEILRFDVGGDGVRAVVVAPDGRTAYATTRGGDFSQWLIVTDPAEVMAWLPDNRYMRDLTCSERDQYQVTPLCTGDAESGD